MNKIKIFRILLFAAVALTLASTPVFAVEYYLRAVAVTKTMPGAVNIPMWGFALENSTFTLGAAATVPGPELTVPPGDTTLTVHVRNGLSVPVSLVIPGQIPATAPVTVKALDGRGRQRIHSLTHETPPDDSTVVDYVWNNVKPGSYVYYSGTHPAVQVQMGLYGAMIHDEPDILTYHRAYPTVVYSDSVALFFSEIDPALHAAVNDGSYGIPPAMTSTINYKPKYFLVNGQPYDPASPPAALAAGSSGGGTLLRIFNMGLKSRFPLLLNSNMSLVAEDGQPYTYSKEQYVAFASAGKTIDAQVAFPAAGTYHVIDRALGLTNSAATNGGMRADLAVTAGAPWPVITSVTATPASIPDTGLTTLAVTTTAVPVTSYAWSDDFAGGTFSDATIANPTWTPPFAPGVHTYTLQVVVGNAAGIDIGVVDVTVTGNLAPVITSVTAAPMALLSNGSTTQLQVNVTDADGPAPMTYAWNDGGAGGLFSSTAVTNPTYTPLSGSAGSVTLTVEVTDAASATSSDSVNLTVVTSNVAPTISSITANPATIGDNQTSNLSVTASDGGDGPLPLSYNWIVPPGAGSVSDSTIINPVYTPANVLVNTIFTLTVEVSDGIDTTSDTVDVTVMPTNSDPVISSVAAAPNPVLDINTSQLQVLATDADGDTLTYNWIVPPGAGSVSNAATANPVYTPPDIVGADQTFMLTVEVSDGVVTVSDMVSVTVMDALILSATFDVGAEGFTYADAAFGGVNPSYANGVYNAAEGALEVDLGDQDNNLIVEMSGGWESSFTAPAGNVNLSFRYNLTQSPHYETGEQSEVWVDIDGERILSGGNDYFARITGNGNGGPIVTTGWQTGTATVVLTAGGTHTIVVGGFNNLKDKNNEYTTILIDDVLIERAP